jgi:hypothetical protein
MPSWRSGRTNSRVLRHRRAFADCFGANPVASALGNRAKRDPGTAVQPYHEGFKQTFETGTFYLAGNRNFLFGSDSRYSQVVPERRHFRCRTEDHIYPIITARPRLVGKYITGSICIYTRR